MTPANSQNLVLRSKPLFIIAVTVLSLLAAGAAQAASKPSTSSAAATPTPDPAPTAAPPGAASTSVPEPLPGGPTEAPPTTTPPPPAPIAYAEHLGGEAYPDRMRGLYGGSLWLEPSFHGLQWPYMPRTGLGLSGSAWVDTGYETLKRGRPADKNAVLWVQQGRAVARATPAYSDGHFFVQGQLELVANKDQVQTQTSNTGLVDADDLWVRFGTWNGWDVKVGRFEAWEMYHTGMGLDINTIERRGASSDVSSGSPPAPDYYGLTYLHDRPNGQGVGDVAVHVYPTDYLRFELLGQLGVSDYQNAGDNTIGGRPSVIFDLGWFKLKAGGEYLRKTKSLTLLVPLLDENGNQMLDAMGNPIQVKADSKSLGTLRGVGGTAQFILASVVEFGVSGGVGLTDQTDDKGSPIDTQATTTKSIGGFANVALGRLIGGADLQDLMVGAGGNWTTQTDNHRDTMGRIDYKAHLQAFGAVQYLIAHQLFVKAVVAYARSDFDLSFMGGVYSNTMLSGRIRLMYLF